tara:strand:- start:142 stop:951 length:810 start_codon:yes stop_codon:yes gene_type:complete
MSEYLKNGELKTTAIKQLVSAHNKGMSWNIKGLKRAELIKFINDKGYKVDHDANKLTLTGSEMKRRPKTIKPVKKSEAEIQSAKDKKEKAKVKKVQKEKVKKIVAEKGIPALPSKDTIKKVQQKKKDKKIFTMKAQEDLIKQNKKKANMPNVKDAVAKAKAKKDARRKSFLQGGGSVPILKGMKEDEVGEVEKSTKPRVAPSKFKIIDKPVTDKELNDKYGSIKVKALNEILDKLPNTNSKGGGSRLNKIKKILKFKGEKELKKLITNV